MVATTTMSAPGRNRTKRRMTRRAVSDRAPTASVVPLTSPSSRTVSHRRGRESRASTSIPRSFGSCAITSVIATPCRYPISTGREK